MCNRYALTKKQERILIADYGSLEAYWQQRFNIAPTQKAPIVFLDHGELVARDFVWGFKPSWSKGPITNAMFETLDAKPTFKEAFATRRCLVPASGFYEWQTFPTRKQPIRFSLANDRLFFFAGLWSPNYDGAFVIITTAPNEQVARVHNRMPFILREQDHRAWLAPESSTFRTLKPTDEPMRQVWVNSRLNNSRNEGEAFAQPVTATVRNIFGGYPLPDGLPERATVTIADFEAGGYDVEYEGRRFHVSIANVERTPE